MLPLKSSVLTGLAICCLLPLGACANTPWAGSLERSLAADPKLESSPTVFGATQTSDNSSASASGTVAQLPTDFPGEIPRYPNAELVAVTPAQNSAGQSKQTLWATSDKPDQIQQFYKEKFQSDGWQLVGSSSASGANQSAQPGSPSADQAGTIVAKRDGLQVKVALNSDGAAPTATSLNVSGKTAFTIDYQFDNTATASQSSPSPSASSNGSNASPQPGDPNFVGPVPSQNQANQPSPGNSGSASSMVSGPQSFTDLSQAPAQLQSDIADLAKLGVLQLRSSSASDKSVSGTSSSSAFKPNQTVTRREYARWLVAANNLLYANQPARQIRLGVGSEQPAFQDVSKTDPDFSAIQGLADAGLIPSPLSGDSTTVTFRPDAPLTREEMILWKVPVDLRRSLPNASLDAVQQTWGFQDAARIDPRALRAVLADFQNGDLSNIRRAFGYTTLFQPKKAATRAEAAAALWYFGSQGEGISAKDALQGNQQSKQSINQSTSQPTSQQSNQQSGG